MAEKAPLTPFAIVLSVAWFLIGAMWFTQALVPWTSSGTLSNSSSIDAATLIRSGAVGSLAPSSAGWLLLVLPAVGLALGATAFSTNHYSRAFRILSLFIALATTGTLSHYLADFDITNFGPGALLAWFGCIAFVLNLVASRSHFHR